MGFATGSGLLGVPRGMVIQPEVLGHNGRGHLAARIQSHIVDRTDGLNYYLKLARALVRYLNT